MGTVTPTPSDEVMLLFICEPQPVLLSELVEVVTPPVRFTLGSQPALAIFTFMPLLLMASCERSISGRFSSACSYTFCISGIAARI